MNDLAKAFDKVPHQRLLIKLKAHGIDGLVVYVTGSRDDSQIGANVSA